VELVGRVVPDPVPFAEGEAARGASLQRIRPAPNTRGLHDRRDRDSCRSHARRRTKDFRRFERAGLVLATD
jgi:hypothetical protein